MGSHFLCCVYWSYRPCCKLHTVTQSGCVRPSEVWTCVASHQSFGAHTTMLLSGTTLNKAHLLDWSGTLCVRLLDFCRQTIFSIRIFRKTRNRVILSHQCQVHQTPTLSISDSVPLSLHAFSGPVHQLLAHHPRITNGECDKQAVLLFFPFPLLDMPPASPSYVVPVSGAATPFPSLIPPPPDTAGESAELQFAFLHTTTTSPVLLSFACRHC